MALDPRTPVIIGGGQVNQRTAEGDPALEPVDLIVEAARRALGAAPPCPPGSAAWRLLRQQAHPAPGGPCHRGVGVLPGAVGVERDLGHVGQ